MRIKNRTSIFKKVIRERCANYRRIAVAMTRLYGKIFKNKIEKDIEGKIGGERAGFSARKSYLDHIYTLQQVIDKEELKNDQCTGRL